MQYLGLVPIWLAVGFVIGLEVGHKAATDRWQNEFNVCKQKLDKKEWRRGRD